MTATVAPSGSRRRASAGSVWRTPVAETAMSVAGSALSSGATAKPAKLASSARTGSASATVTRAPSARTRRAKPSPTGPKPTTVTRAPPAAEKNDGPTRDIVVAAQVSPVPWRLSKPVFRRESLTATTGNGSSPSCCMAVNARTPEVVSSATPTSLAARVGRSITMRREKFAPSSMTTSGRMRSMRRSDPSRSCAGIHVASASMA